MSSNFSLICASHQPAIVLDGEYPDVRRALEALEPGAGLAAQHPHCDLIVGRWSGGLIELGCLPSNARIYAGQPHTGWHRDVQWVDASWLRLMLLTTPKQHATARIRGCWTQHRIATLHQVLDLEVTTKVTHTSGQASPLHCAGCGREVGPEGCPTCPKPPWAAAIAAIADLDGTP